MGIVNVTPDSFSDGGRFFDVERAVQQGKRLIAEGAAILDIGGESTRPGAAPIAPAEQIRRVVPVIRQLSEDSEAVISIDTMSAEVADAAIAAGASIVNDVSGLQADAEMASLIAQRKVGCVLMHMQGTPQTMQAAPTYTDVVAEVSAALAHARRIALEAGIADEAIVYDPGIGFGKSVEHNLALLRAGGALSPDGRPLLLGVSRKSVIGRVLGTDDLTQREWAGVALTAHGREKGARLFRVHDVAPHSQALRMVEAIHGPAHRSAEG